MDDIEFKVQKTDAEWRNILSEDEFRIGRQKGTEPAFNNAYWDLHDEGTFSCKSCDQLLFDSSAKYDSGTGWPSFSQPVSEEVVLSNRDGGFGMDREEIICSNCGAHLGHVFDDGPEPTGLRYCMNSASLQFHAK